MIGAASFRTERRTSHAGSRQRLSRRASRALQQRRRRACGRQDGHATSRVQCVPLQRLAASSARFSAQHVHARLAEQAERAALRCGGDQLRAPRSAGSWRTRATRAAWYCAAASADVRVESAGRCGHQVDRHRRRVAGVGGAQRLDAAPSPPRPAPGSAGPGSSRAMRRRCMRIGAGRRRAAPEVLRVAEGLADQLTSRPPCRRCCDQAAVGLRGKQRPGRCRSRAAGRRGR